MDFANYWFSSGSGGDGPDPGLIPNSVRFRRIYANDSRLERNPGAAGNRNTWSLSCWVKPSNYAQNGDDLNIIFSTSTTSTSNYFYFGRKSNYNNTNANEGQIQIYNGSATKITSAKFRDYSAWYHWFMTFNSGTLRLWVNGVEQTWASNPGFGSTTAVNSNTRHTWGCGRNSGAQPWSSWSGGLSEVHFIDGTNRAVTDFAQFNNDNVWMPREVSLTTAEYGNQGYYLDFSDPNNIGADRSGNGNNFTPQSMSLSTPTDRYYAMIKDTPTNNHLSFNQPGSRKRVAANAQVQSLLEAGWYTSGANYDWWQGSHSIRSDDSEGWYCEFYQWTYAAYNTASMWDTDFGAVASTHSGNNIGVNTAAAAGISFGNTGELNNYGSYVGNFGAWSSTSDVIMFAVKANNVWVGKNGTWFSSGNPSTGANPTFTLSSNKNFSFAVNTTSSGLMGMNSGTLDYRYTKPTGFKDVSTAVMPEPSLPATLTGSFVGNNKADGPFIWTGCVPGRIQYGSVDVLYQNRLSQSNVDFLTNGFKVRSTTSNSGTVSYTVTTTHTGGEYSGSQVPFGGAGVSPAPACSN